MHIQNIGLVLKMKCYEKYLSNMKTKIILILFTIFIFNSNLYSQNFQWAKNMGGNFDSYGMGITTDDSGYVYTIGYFEGTVDFDPGIGVFNVTSIGQEDIFISKLDALGNFQWVKTFGNIGQDKGSAITLDGLGNLYATGGYHGSIDFDPGIGISNLDSNGAFILKLTTSGNFVWVKGFISSINSGGSSIGIGNSGDVFITGNFRGTGDFDPGSSVFNLTSSSSTDQDIFIAKLNLSGNFIWAKRIGGNGNDQGVDLIIDPSDNIVVTGNFHGTVDFDPGLSVVDLTSWGFSGIYVLKLNSIGDMIWAKSFGDGNGTSIIQDPIGNIYICGLFDTIGDFDPGVATFNLASSGNFDVFISKLDANGNFKWAKKFGGLENDFGYSIAMDGYGHIFTTGRFQGTVDFDPNNGIFNLTSTNISTFISELDTLGNFIWAGNISGANTCVGFGIAIDGLNNIFTTGTFQGTIDFDPGIGTSNLSAISTPPGSDIFISKLGGGATGIKNIEKENSISIYPNPANNQLNIKIPFRFYEAKYRIINEFGIELLSGKLMNNNSKIDISNLKEGVYILNINNYVEQTFLIQKK